jgi:N-acylneuraminate cytidylyltransferase
MEILGVIPARGGSKSIPRKNIKLLLGKPLIAWIIAEAKKSKLLTRVIVSTDDEEIAEIARLYGAEVPFLRPAEISGDTATDVEFFNHALNWLNEHENYEPDIILRLSPTSPLNKAEYIDAGITTLLNTSEADAVRPVCEVGSHPYKYWTISEGQKLLAPFLSEDITGFHEAWNLPRQLFPKVYTQTGAMDIIRTKTLREQQSTSGKKLSYIFMSPEDAVDIDNLIDFEIAEFLLKKRLQESM